MSKKVISLLTVMAIILSLFVFPALSVNAEDTVQRLEVTGITVKLDGTSVPVINKSSTYDVSVEILAVTDLSNPYIAVLLCEGTKDKYIVRSMAEITDVSLASDGTATKNVQLSSSNTTEKFIKIISTTEKDKSTRIGEDAFFPTGDELKLKGITINGVSIPKFDKEIYSYEYMPPIGTALPLDIKLDKICDIIDEDVANIEEYPGTVKITLSYGDLTPVEYTVNILEPKPTITFVKNPSNWTISENIQIGTTPYMDNTKGYNATSFQDFPELQGMTAIQTSRVDRTNEDFIANSTTEWAEIKIDNSADIYILYPYDPITNSSSKYMSWLRDDSYIGVIDEDTPSAAGNAKLSTDYSTNGKKKYYVFKRTVSIVAGETANIKFKTQGTADDENTPYMIALDWIENKEPEETPVSLMSMDENEPVTDYMTADNLQISFMSEDENLNTDINEADYTIMVSNNEVILEGKGAIAGSEILLKIYKPDVALDNAKTSDIIYYNIITADDEGKYKFEFLVDEFRGEFAYGIVSDENAYLTESSFVYDPSDDNTIHSMKLNGEKCDIEGDEITAELDWDTNLGGVLVEFDIHMDAKMYYNGTVLESGKSKLNLKSDLTLKVVAANNDEKEYTLEATLEEKKSSGGGGGGSTVKSTGTITSSGSGNIQTDITTPTVVRKLYSDIPDNYWAYDAIDYLSEKDIISGYTDGSFNPDGYIKREEFTKIIVKAFSLVPGNTETQFSDVSGNDWFKHYVDIASSNEVIMGDNLGNFGVGNNITREDMSVILYRVLVLKGEKLAQGNLEFTDKEEISLYAEKAMETLYSTDIISGYPDNTLRPKKPATRAEVCAMIFNILNK